LRSILPCNNPCFRVIFKAVMQRLNGDLSHKNDIPQFWMGVKYGIA
jgi:hypothetical protein